MRLYLFDIDGTLLTAGRQVLPIFAETLTEVFGETGDLESFNFGGKTDPQIVLELLMGVGWAEAEVVERLPAVRDRYLGRLERELQAERMRLFPGVRKALDRLAGRPEAVVGLLTGNWERGGRAKLSRLDLNDYFPFGGFGDDGVARADLVPAAMERAQRHSGRRFSPEETLIIGDTVYDVACAQAHGVPVLAVATGRTPAERLREAGATWVVPDLEAAGELLA